MRPPTSPAPRWLFLALLALSGAGTSGCSTLGYLAQQGAGQLQLLRARRRVDDVIADPATPRWLRQRLRLALEARRFGIEVLGLRDGGEFTRYVDTGGPVAYSVSAAQRTELALYRWHFPLVGSVPYLGFFQRAAAVAQARRLERQGYDTYLRPVSGYSTLGYLLSPIYASMVDEPGEKGAVRTVEVILHEMAHTTAYLTSASELNEGFATLVGVQGAALFFRLRGSPESGRNVLRDAVEQERQAQAFSDWLVPALQRVRDFYAQARRERWPASAIVDKRKAVFEELMNSYRAAFPEGQRSRRLAYGPLNNAVLMSFGVYHRSAELQQALLASVDGDLRAYVDLYRRAQARPDGPEWLKRLAEEYKAVPRQGAETAPSAAP